MADLVLMNMHGKIQPPIISKKLGVGICNPASDWVDGLQKDFQEELLIHNHNLESYRNTGKDCS